MYVCVDAGDDVAHRCGPAKQASDPLKAKEPHGEPG